MRYITLLFLVLAFESHAQKIALLGKDFKQPIIYTDSLTAEQLNHYFPIETSAFDTLYAGLVYLKTMLQERQRSKMISFELRAGSTSLKTNSVPHAYGDHFNIIAKTKIGELASRFSLTLNNNNNNGNAKRINQLIKYIDRNKSLFTNPEEIHPRFYNVVVVTR